MQKKRIRQLPGPEYRCLDRRKYAVGAGAVPKGLLITTECEKFVQDTEPDRLRGDIRIRVAEEAVGVQNFELRVQNFPEVGRSGVRQPRKLRKDEIRPIQADGGWATRKIQIGDRSLVTGSLAIAGHFVILAGGP
jgi:hypothetical protein